MYSNARRNFSQRSEHTFNMYKLQNFRIKQLFMLTDSSRTLKFFLVSVHMSNNGSDEFLYILISWKSICNSVQRARSISLQQIQCPVGKVFLLSAFP